MQTKELTYKLQLMINTIEELEIDNIIGCEVTQGGNMKVFMSQLTITGAEGVWSERLIEPYPWEKSYYYNNIYFYAIYTQEEYDKERSS